MKQGEQFNLFNEKNEPIVTLSPGQLQIAKKYEEFNVEAGKFKRTGNDWYYEDTLVDDEWEKTKVIAKYKIAGSTLAKLHKKDGVWCVGDESAKDWDETMRDLEKHEKGERRDN